MFLHSKINNEIVFDELRKKYESYFSLQKEHVILLCRLLNINNEPEK